MTRLRRTLGRIAVTWLLCQVSTMTLAPIVMWFGSGEALLECTCTHGDHAICPMHHKPVPGSKICLMGSADNDSTGVLTSVFGGVGLAPAPTPAAVPPGPLLAVLALDTTAHSLRPAPPDPPPPRV